MNFYYKRIIENYLKNKNSHKFNELKGCRSVPPSCKNIYFIKFLVFIDQILDISQPHFIILQQSRIQNIQLAIIKFLLTNLPIYQFLLFSIIIKSKNICLSEMRNFNKDEIQKYEKITRNAFSKTPRLSKLGEKISLIRLRHILLTFAISGFSYMAYRIYDHKKYRSQHYINIFQWKSKISSSIRRKDLFQKISSLSFTKNSNNAIDNYQRVLTQEFDNYISKIKLIKTDQQTHDKQIPKSKNQKKERERERRKNILEIVLSRSYKSKLDLGYFFKLHTKQYMTTITNKGEVIKKTYIVPVMIFDVPFFAEKKQQVSKIKKNTKYAKVISQKSKFNLSSECEKINYWNTLFMKSQEIEQKKPEFSQNQANIKDQNSEEKKIEKMLNSNKNKKQLLFECRNRIKLREQKLQEELKSLVLQHWQKKSKIDTDQAYSFSIKTWDEQGKK